MNKLKTILVGVDFSSGSSTALAQAVRLARSNDAALHIIHVVQRSVIVDLAAALQEDEDALRERIVADARKDLHELLAAADPPPKITVHVEVGSPIEEIIEKVEATAADLLVMGVTGATGEGTGAGSLATKCVRKAPTKVLLVHEAHREAFRRVLACTDFSETAEQAVSQAVLVAHLDGSRLDVLHVFQGPWHRLHYRSPTPQAAPDYRKQYEAALHARLEGCLARHQADVKGLDVRFELMDYPNYGRGIIEYAQKCDADLIVIGSQGRSSLRTVLLGSTADRVLREVASSLLVIKPPTPREA